MTKEDIFSTAEMTAFLRCAEPEISGDAESIYLCSEEGVRQAKELEKYVYPVAGRHLSVRARFFLAKGRELIESEKLGGCVSLGSGLSLLTSLIKRETKVQVIDVDAPKAIETRARRVREKEACLRLRGLKNSVLTTVDLENAEGLAVFFDSLKPLGRLLLIAEGLVYYLSAGAVSNVLKFVSDGGHVLLVDYWPQNAEKSATFRRIMGSSGGHLPENVRRWREVTEIISNFAGLRIVERFEIGEYEKGVAADGLLGDFDRIVPTRFAVISN